MDRAALTVGPGMDMPIMHDNDRYELVRDIGSGNFGIARLMRDKQSKELVAVKYIERGEKIDDNVQREIINHRSPRHPNIIRFKEVILTPTHLAIVMEFASGGELFERICNIGRFSEDEVSSRKVGISSFLQEMRQQLDETNAILLKEQEAAKKASERAHVIQAFHVIDTSLMGKLNDEEAWTQENAKLQAALQEMRQQLDETKAMLVKEQEAAKKASEGAHAIQEFPVIDTTFSDKLNDEEAKTQENAKLRSALQEMQRQLDETKAMLVKEQEACKNASEGAYAIQEFPVIDSALTDKLNDENEKLKALVNSLERKIDETEKKYEERLKKELDAESKIIDLNKAMQSLKKKVSDTEEQTLRQKALLHSPANRMLGYLSIPSTPTKYSLENGHHRFGDAKESHSAPPSFFAKSDSKLRRSYIERHHEYVDALIHCVNQNIDFSEGKPVAAFTTYKCLLHWKSFEAEKTSVFDRLIQMIGSAVEDLEEVRLILNSRRFVFRSRSSIDAC